MAAYAISIYLVAVSIFEKVAVFYEQVCVHMDSFTETCVSVSEGLVKHSKPRSWKFHSQHMGFGYASPI